MEQTIEWSSPLYLLFVDFEKAFDSVDREAMWRILRHYGIPDKIINMLKVQYEGFTCQVLHGGTMTEPIEVKTGVRQGCLLSPLLWKWIGHTLRKPENNINHSALEWNPQESRRRGHPKQSWRRSVKDDLAKKQITWIEAK